MKTKNRLSVLLTVMLSSITLIAQENDLPVKEEEVTFSSGDAVYSGTLSMPAADGVYPLVIMVSGMGPQDRDWAFANGKYKMAKIISDYLNQNGIAVYRYDDRGYQKSTGTPEGQMSFEDLAHDVQNAVSMFRTRKDIGKIGLCGHSLGGILAVISAAENKNIDFIITVSGAFRNGADIMKEQAATLKRWRTSDSMTDQEVIANGVQFVDYLVSYANSGNGEEKIRQGIENLVNYQISKLSPEKMAQNLKIFKNREDMFNQSVNEAYTFYTSPHQKSFVTYNAADDISKITCPMLVLFGEIDKHVVVSSNMPPVAEGLKNSKITDFTMIIIPGADHGYSNSTLVKEGRMVPVTLTAMTNWILTRTGSSTSVHAGN